MKKHKQWSKPRKCIVFHPDYQEPAIVQAYDEPDAICRAALYWSRKWTEYNFYGECTVFSEKRPSNHNHA